MIPLCRNEPDSIRLTRLNFQPGFWNKSSENQIVDYMERDSARPNGPENLKKSHVIETEFQPGPKKEREHAHLSKLSHEYLRFAPGLKFIM